MKAKESFEFTPDTDEYIVRLKSSRLKCIWLVLIALFALAITVLQSLRLAGML